MKEQGITNTASKFFTERVRRNLHVLVIFADCGDSLQQLTMRFPALLRKVYVIAPPLPTSSSTCSRTVTPLAHAASRCFLYTDTSTGVRRIAR
jgi:hypothetical protein